MGYVMSGTSVALLVGPSIGGWLYAMGGIELPFVFVAGLAFACAIGFLAIRTAPAAPTRTAPSAWSVVRTPAVAECAAYVVVMGATLAMLEPVLPLFFSRRLGMSPPQVGLLFGAAAGVLIVMPIVYGPLIGRWGNRRLVRQNWFWIDNYRNLILRCGSTIIRYSQFEYVYTCCQTLY